MNVSNENIVHLDSSQSQSGNVHSDFHSSLISSNSFSDDSIECKSKDEQNIEADKPCEMLNEESESPEDYLDRVVFPVLLPCLEQMIFAAKENKVLKVQKSRFNGIDYLAELLWNRNPYHPERKGNHVSIFDIPFSQIWLEKNPRPIYPKSWLWTPTEAAIVIQSAVRGYFVRRMPEVQELRQFWKTLAIEKETSTVEQSHLDMT